ncbi:MAG: hypothetical protein AAF570_06130 [Bacteroidota bacterium]
MYAGGSMYPLSSTNMTTIQNSGITTIMCMFLRIESDGTLRFHGEDLVTYDTTTQTSTYVGSSTWNSQLTTLMGSGSSVNEIGFTIGGAGSTAFGTINTMYNNQSQNTNWAAMSSNFACLLANVPNVTFIDMDVEEEYHATSFAQFCIMLADAGYDITFCPSYSTLSSGKSAIDWWAAAMQTIEASKSGSVVRVNLQCYSGGAGNNPSHWANIFHGKPYNLTTTGLFLASQLARHYVNTQEFTGYEGDCPNSVQTFMTSFAKENCVSGAFIYSFGEILKYPGELSSHTDPDQCGTDSLADYVSAMKNGLEGTSPS